MHLLVFRFLTLGTDSDIPPTHQTTFQGKKLFALHAGGTPYYKTTSGKNRKLHFLSSCRHLIIMNSLKHRSLPWEILESCGRRCNMSSCPVYLQHWQIESPCVPTLTKLGRPPLLANMRANWVIISILLSRRSQSVLLVVLSGGISFHWVL